MERLTVHGAWWLRKECLDDAVQRTSETFRDLAELSSHWRGWYAPHDSLEFRGRPETQLSGRPDLIRERFLLSQEPDEDGPPNKDLGYRLSAASAPQNGKGIERSYFSVRCCSCTKYSGFNTLSIQLPKHECVPPLYDSNLLGLAVLTLANIWDPDWLSVWDLRTHLIPEPWPPWPAFGWINYLAPRVGTVRDLPRGWQWFEHRGGRQIFIHSAGPPEANNPGHRAAFNEMFAHVQWGDEPAPL
jgi:hypothetical protein